MVWKTLILAWVLFMAPTLQIGVGISSEFPIVVNGVQITIKVTDFEARTQDQLMMPEGTMVTVRSPVATFILDQESTYTIAQYAYYAKCKCFWSRTSICGGDCPSRSDGTCISHRETGIWCTGTNAWCLSTWPSSKKVYNSYSLRLFGAFTTLDYQSPFASAPNLNHPKNTNPDPSLRTVALGKTGQSYASTAYLRELSPRARRIEDLVWLPHDGSVVTRDQLATLNNPPKYTTNAIDADNWDCAGKTITATFDYPKMSAQSGFSLFIVDRPAVKSIYATNLLNDRITLLTQYGLAAYSDSSQPIVDPCMGTIIRLDADNEGVKVFSDPALTKGPNCLVVQESTSQYILALVEFDPDDKAFKPSKRFYGAISPDYFQSYTLRVTSGADFVPNIETVDLSFKFSQQGSSLYVTISTTSSTKCEVSLSSNCTVPLDFTTTFRNITVDATKCLPLQARVDYHCGLASGWVQPPITTTSLNVTDSYTEIPANETFIPEKNDYDIGSQIKDFFSWFSPGHLVLIVGVIILVSVACRGLSTLQGRRTHRSSRPKGIYQLPAEHREN